MKRPKISDCPFRIGDIVRSGKNRSIANDKPLMVDRVMLIPDVRNGQYRQDIIDLPYWIFTHYVGVKPYVGNVSADYPGAIWVGFMELDPFLGNAKRAVMDADV